MMSFTTTFVALAALASTALALPVPAAHQNEKRYSGVRMTYYDTSVGLGACGNLNQNSAWTVALNAAQFGNSYPSSECGKTITISYGGKTAQAVIQDSCPGCPYGGLDLSPSLFQHFTDLGTGVISADWDYGSGAPAPAPAPEPTTTWHAPTSTWVAPTTSWTPEPSTSSTPPPAPTTTWTPPTTSAAPATSSTPAPSSSAPASSVAASSSSVAASASSSAASSTASATATNSESLLAALMSTPTGSATASSSATPSGSAGSDTEQGDGSDGNLQMLSNVIVNMGRLVVMAA